MTKRLLRDGYSVRVPPNNLRSLPDDSATIADFLGTLTGPIVLVGHSYGGAVITNAATGNPDVKALVYVDAFAPDEGETVLAARRARLGPRGRPGDACSTSCRTRTRRPATSTST